MDYLILHPGKVGDLQGYILVKNLGNGKFEAVEDEVLSSIKFSESPKKVITTGLMKTTLILRS